MFKCINRLSRFFVISELVTLINFAFVTQHVALVHDDVSDREDLSKGIESYRHNLLNFVQFTV